MLPGRSTGRSQNNQTFHDSKILQSGQGTGAQQHLRSQPSDASLDILIQSSPERSLHQRSASVLSGSQGGGRGNGRQLNQNELRQAERNATGTPSRRRRRKHRAGFGGDGGGGAAGIGRPVNLKSPSPDGDGPFLIEDDLSPAKEVVAPSRMNTNMSIVLPNGRPGASKGRFRDRMDSSQQGQQGWRGPGQSSMGPPQRQNGKPSIYGTKHHSESVDELSEEYFPEPSPKRQQQARNPVVHLGDPPARAAGAAAEKRRQMQQQQQQQQAKPLSASPKASASPGNSSSAPQVPMMAEAIIASPLQVKDAFRQPSTYFVADPDAGVSLFPLSINPHSSNVLVPAEPKRARSDNLFWLKADLSRIREISFNVDSPIVFITLPQGDGLGALMGLQFDTVEEVRRLAAWVTSSRLSQSIKLDQATPREQLKRKFDKCLADVQGHKEQKEAKELTPAKLGSGKETALGTNRSSPVVSSNSTTERMAFRRTRSSHNLHGAAETVDLDGTTDNKQSSTLGSSPTSSDVANDRLMRLRNRGARLPATRPLLQDMEFDRWTLKNPDWAREWRVPLTYSRTTVDKDDVARLDEGEFLNDNIINFYMQFLQDTLKKSESSIAKRVYFHNTFFYEKLRPSKGREIAFDGVKRWTAKTDLFSYDYIIIPVNEHAHWWLAIICNVPKILAAALPKTEEPEAEKKAETAESSEKPTVPVDVDVDADDDDVKETGVFRFVPIDVDGPKPRPQSVVIDDEDGAAKHASASPPRLDGQRKDTPIDVDDAEAQSDEKRKEPIVLDSVETDDPEAKNATKDGPKPADKVHEIKDDAPHVHNVDNVDSNDDDEVTEIKSDLVQPTTPQPAPAKKPFRGGGALNSKKVFIPPGKKKDPKDPRIFTLDSLGSVHSASVDHLKQWLVAEIAERKGVKPADPGRLGMTAKAIPQQENFCDCGVYLLLYIREFVKDPDSFIEDIVLRQDRTWDTSAPDMRKQLRDLILHMQKEYQAAEEANRKPKRKLVASKRPTLTVAAHSTIANSKTPDAQTTPVHVPDSPSLLQLSSPPAPVAAGRPTPASADVPKDEADVPIPSSEMDQRGDRKDNQGDDQRESLVGSSANSIEADCGSPFRHGSGSPSVFEQGP